MLSELFKLFLAEYMFMITIGDILFSSLNIESIIINHGKNDEKYFF